MRMKLGLVLCLFAFGCSGAGAQRRRAMADEKMAAAEFDVNAAHSEDVWRHARPLLDNAQSHLARARELMEAKKYDVAGRWARSASAGAKKAVDYAQKVKARAAAEEAKAAAEEARAFREGKKLPKPSSRKTPAPPQGP